MEVTKIGGGFMPFRPPRKKNPAFGFAPAVANTRQQIPVFAQLPPNFEEIDKTFKLTEQGYPIDRLVFTYGEAIYAPGGRQLPRDIIVHESVHVRQQKKIGVKRWWSKYLNDVDFRFSQELEAYAHQAKYWKGIVNEKKYMQEVDRLAIDLSGPTYGNVMSFLDTRAKIVSYVGKIT